MILAPPGPGVQILSVYGSDFSAVEDLDFGLTFLDGDVGTRKALVQAVARRFLTPRGGWFPNRTYGFDLRSLLADTLPRGAAESAVAAEGRKDGRIRTSEAIVTDDESGSRSVEINVTPVDEGPFRLTFALSPEGIALL